MNAPFTYAPEYTVADLLRWCDARRGRCASLSSVFGKHPSLVARLRRRGAVAWPGFDPQAVQYAIKRIEQQERQDDAMPRILTIEKETRPVPGRCGGWLLASGEYMSNCKSCSKWMKGGSVRGAIRPRIVDGRCGQWRPE